MTADAPPALPPYISNQLGPKQAALAVSLRMRLWAAKVRWPSWIDARPGHLGAIVADCTDPPLGLTRAQLAQKHDVLLVEGLGALGLALAAPRLGLVVSNAALVQVLAKKWRTTSIEFACALPVFPAQPERAVQAENGLPWVVPAETLAAAGAALRGSEPPHLCSVVGAVQAPTVLELAADETPRQLLRRAGGAQSPAWVALCHHPLGGELWSADAALPAHTQTVYFLPPEHSLVRRQKMAQKERARAACISCRLCTDFCPQAEAGTAPHRILRAIFEQAQSEPAVEIAAARACTGCGACSAVCPADLLPGALMALLAQALPNHEAKEPPRLAQESRLPLDLVLSRLGLAAYART